MGFPTGCDGCDSEENHRNVFCDRCVRERRDRLEGLISRVDELERKNGMMLRYLKRQAIGLWLVGNTRLREYEQITAILDTVTGGFDPEKAVDELTEE